jgi:hypothetical protein
MVYTYSLAMAGKDRRADTSETSSETVSEEAEAAEAYGKRGGHAGATLGCAFWHALAAVPLRPPLRPL